MGLLAVTKWTAQNPHTLKLDMKKSRKRCLVLLRRLDTTPRLFTSCPSLDGMETTCWSPVTTRNGSRDLPSNERKATTLQPPSLMLWTAFSPLSVPQRSLFVFPYRMSTRLVVLEQYLLDVWKLVSLSLVWLSHSPPLTSPLKSNPLKCIMKLCQKLSLVRITVDTLLCWIVTQLTLLVSSKKFNRKSIVVQVKFLRKTQRW